MATKADAAEPKPRAKPQASVGKAGKAKAQRHTFDKV